MRKYQRAAHRRRKKENIMSNVPIPLPEKAKQRVQQSIDAIEEMQRNAGTFLEGVAATLDVPQGYTFDQNVMAFVPPVAPPSEAAPIAGEQLITEADGVLDVLPEPDTLNGAAHETLSQIMG